MSKRILSGLYLLAVIVVAVVACVGLMQVPQPWRGMLVLVLCSVGVVGTVVFLAMRQHYDYRALRLQQSGQPNTSRQRPVSREAMHCGGMRVITSQSSNGTQRILR